MSRKSRWEYFRAVYARYQKASQEKKQVMLDEFCSNTGYNRKYAIRLLNGSPPEKRGRTRRRRSASYGAGLIRLLAVVWEAAGGWLSLVGSLEGRAAVVAAMDSKTISSG